MPGIVAMPADRYHADLIDDQRPSLSASIASILVDKSPAHARAAHPRLNPDWQPRDEERFDIGRCAHAWFLEGDDGLVVVDAADWRTKDAKEQRELARSEGRTPLLARQWDEVKQMVKAMADQLAALDLDPPLFTDGKPEQTLVWEEDGVLCRARLDWLRDDLATIDDLKTTSASANPERWTRTLFGIGADVQAAFYLRGLAKTAGPIVAGMADFRWVVVETYPPYALSVVSLAPDALALANEKVDNAIAIWRRCLERDEWPAYPTEVAYAEAPAWEMARWMERDARDAA